MEKTILLGEKEMKFKSSAATNIFYKKVFGEDILLKFAEYAKNLKDIKSAQAKIDELRNDTTRPKEEVLNEMNALLNSDMFKSSSEFQSETLPRLAFIMWLEGNNPGEQIMSKLNQEQYLFWLMTVDQDELFELVSPIMDLWQAGSKTHSKPKN